MGNHICKIQGSVRIGLFLGFAVFLASTAARGQLATPTKEGLVKEVRSLQPVACDASNPHHQDLYRILTESANALADLLKSELNENKAGAWAKLAPVDRNLLVNSHQKTIDALLANPCGTAAQNGAAPQDPPKEVAVKSSSSSSAAPDSGASPQKSVTSIDGAEEAPVSQITHSGVPVLTAKTLGAAAPVMLATLASSPVPAPTSGTPLASSAAKKPDPDPPSPPTPGPPLIAGAQGTKPTCSLSPTSPPEVKTPVYIGAQSSVTVCADPSAVVSILVQGQKAAEATLVGEFAAPEPLDLTKVQSLAAQQSLDKATSTSASLAVVANAPVAKEDVTDTSSPCSESGNSLLPFIVGSVPAGQNVQVVVCAQNDAKVTLLDENGKQVGKPLALAGVFSATAKIGANQAVSATQTFISKGTQERSAEVMPTAAPAGLEAKSNSSSGSAKPPSQPCFAVKPDWISVPKDESTPPVAISSCDSPPADLSDDTVELDPQGHEEVALVLPCRPTASVISCDVKFTAPPRSSSYAVGVVVYDKNHTPLVTKPLHIGDPSRYWMGLGGLDLTSTTNGPSQDWFVRASLMEKLFPYPGAASKHGVWGWLDAQLASMPTLKTSAISSFSSVSSAVSGTGLQSIGDIAQTLGFRTGVSFYVSHRIGIITGFGGSSPVNPISGAQEYTLSNDLYTQFTTQPANTRPSQSLQLEYPQLYTALQNNAAQTGGANACYSVTPAPSGCKTTVAFVLPSRSRFYRSYFGGLRLWTKEGDGSIFPGLVDVTVGQNETVTGGIMRGVVGTITGDYPLGGGTFRIFGSAFLRLAVNTNSTALDMASASTPVSTTSSTVVLQQTLPQDQDYFRVGIAIEISKAWAALESAKKSSAAQ